MNVIQAFSGGAQGADTAWEAEAKKVGLPITFTHYRPEHAAGLSAENTAVVRKAIIEACKSMGRLWPTNSLAYIQRNYLIARSCDKLWAVAPMMMHGDFAVNPYGGTAWAVEFAIRMGKQVVFFDQLKEVWWWYHHPFACWIPLEGITDSEQELILTTKPALIGARQLSKAGLAAIQQVLTQTKERNASYERRTQADGTLPRV